MVVDRKKIIDKRLCVKRMLAKSFEAVRLS
jgi:hypothetical protein